jgi:putative aminopeptidase FrvX
VAPPVLAQIREWFRRYGLLRLAPGRGGRLLLQCDDAATLATLLEQPTFAALVESDDGASVAVAAANRGLVKQTLVRLGYPVDDRAGCAVLIELARALASRKGGPTVHCVWSVQEEFNLRGAVVAAQALAPDIALQIDLMLATDTPDMADRGEMTLGGGPGISLYSFHGRGTLNGVIPHPALVRLVETEAATASIPLQRSAQVGVLTDLSYVQTLGAGVASLDIGFPMRHSHSALECCDLADLAALTDLTLAALARIGPEFDLARG